MIRPVLPRTTRSTILAVLPLLSPGPPLGGAISASRATSLITRAAIAVLLCAPWLSTHGQNTDSLWTVWQDPGKADTLRFQALGKSAWAHMFTDADSSLTLAMLLYEKAGEKNDRRHQAMALTYQGIAYNVLGNHFAARESYVQMLDLYTLLGDRSGVAGACNNLGALFHEEGDHLTAVGWYAKSIAIFEKAGDNKGLATAYNNVSGIYNELGDTANALSYARKALAITEGSGDGRARANTISNMGLIELEGGRPQAAMELFRQSLALKRALGDEGGEAKTLHDIGEAFRRLGGSDSAEVNMRRALAIREALHDEPGLGVSYASMGFLELDRGHPALAVEWCAKSVAIGRDLDIRSTERNACDCLYKAHKALGQGAKALPFFERFTALGDSLHKEEVDRRLRQLEFNRQVMADSLRAAEQALRSDDSKGGGPSKTPWLIGGGGVIVAVVALARRRRRTGQSGAGK